MNTDVEIEGFPELLAKVVGGLGGYMAIWGWRWSSSKISCKKVS
jgi:hypothetical protein